MSAPSVRIVVFAFGLGIALGQAGSWAWAAQAHRVSQKGRAFSVKEIQIASGDALHFTNEDEFLHQIYVKSRSLNFDSDEQAPGQSIDVTFPAPGRFEVRCHIHPKMLLEVTVK